MKTRLTTLGLLGWVVLLSVGCSSSAGGEEEEVDEGALAGRTRCGPPQPISDDPEAVKARCNSGGAVASTSHAYIEMKSASNGKRYFLTRLHEASLMRDGKKDLPVLVSELYSSKAALENGVGALARAVKTGAKQLEVRSTSSGEGSYFVVKAVGNGAVLQTSGVYETPEDAQKAIQQVVSAFRTRDAALTTGEVDTRASWAVSGNYFMLKAGNGREMLSGKATDPIDGAIRTHELGAMDRAAALQLKREVISAACAKVASLAVSQFVPLTEHLGLAQTGAYGAGAESRESGFTPVVLQSVPGASGETQAVLAVGNQFDNCDSALASLNTVARILDSMPRD